MGSSLTITDIDLATLQRLESEARRRGVDVGTVARELLRQAAPPATPPPQPVTTVHHDLDSLAGTWSDADARAFEDGVSDLARVDPELWK